MLTVPPNATSPRQKDFAMAGDVSRSTVLLTVCDSQPPTAARHHS